MLKSGLNNLYPTPLYLGEIQDSVLLGDLLQSIFLNINLDRPASDFQGYDVLKDGPQEFQEFRNKVVFPAFDAYLTELGYNMWDFPDVRLRSWITGVRNGYMIPAHNHSGASFSAVFYLMCETAPNDGGELVLLDPRTNANRGYKDPFKPLFENTTYSPKSGEYVIFPSYLYHHTIAYTGDMRIAMPVDLFL